MQAEEVVGSRITNQSLSRWLHSLPGVDKVGLEARAASLATRSIKTSSKAWGLDMAIKMMDLTTLEGMDTPERVRSLCQKAMTPDLDDPECPTPAAICVYGDMVTFAKAALGRSKIYVAAVATAFPSGRAGMKVKLQDTKDAVANGADEIDMVIDRGAFLSGNYLEVYKQIQAIKEACKRPKGAPAHLKVILETGELQTYDNIRRASYLAMLAGADFIKTSTGKVSVNATLPTTLLMLEAVRDWHEDTGELIGVKPAGGIRTAKDALRYLVVVKEIAGERWLDPNLFRFGASSLLNDVLMQRKKLLTKTYLGPDYVSVD
ncbi:MAG: deoxyribose-phosphate aldolase [Candidatus Aquiluna sp. XM-24bin5]|nr:MAG: deoxyribose-phosphate aldolase [Candidatus Aquiluna sp. XM-24bin5]